MSTNWADEVDGVELPQTFTDANGITTYIEYRVNDDGTKIKITRRTRKKLIHDVVNKAVAARKDDKQEAMKQQLLNKKILCRICKGDHFTSRCPYKDSLGVEDAAAVFAPASVVEADPEEQPTAGKYVAPHMRSSASRGSDRGGGSGGMSDRDALRERREDQPTLRVTNLSEDVTDSDVMDLFNRFGHISRVFLARDRETNVCKGFAFVSFSSREDAQRALETVDGRGYDNLILRVEWAKSSA
ncbi:translation initiation factor eIF3 subunit g [Modicella reniformis]|uniref:Eukaryotic translation initiation factor 3 subunit G n=1 Tax=Modicella reniformis TaxID=1440133 RepID=A0A9P6IHL0_9FUNG|nr:translation initiation factor eIF3 subunit g [Modicella reniformis]